jgi:hypothetical protein
MGTTEGIDDKLLSQINTNGLVSAYQLLDLSAQRIAPHNLSTTNPMEPFIKLEVSKELWEKKSEEELLRTIFSREIKGNLELAEELSAWDVASDEALMIFEAKLD